MVKFRRSIKGGRGEPTKQHSISIPQKDPIAIVPPKKVIKALYDWQPMGDLDPNFPYLSFSAGDFLHVVDQENDESWYMACNPLLNTKGLVPANHFDTIGKAVRDSGGSASSMHSQPIPGHDSGYAEASRNTGFSRASTLGASSESVGQGSRLSKNMGKGSGAMVYGIVSYDFHAERPDELEAKEGEAIIVIAQSNPEWFVAKPITRLGGPGLIPVSFIEIRDMVTGKAVADPQEAVQRAGVPKVEEWKKMAADYKNGSIPLGQLSTGGAQQGMERLSINSGGQETANGYGSANSHTRSQSASQQSSYQQRPPSQLLAPIKATVPRYCFADENFWFIVECQMEDGRHYELSRFYKDFYDLQISLIQEFPLEAGNVQGKERTLPYMPGPLTNVTHNISNGRRVNLDEYLRKLLGLGPHITGCYLVRRFFAPREGDYEIDSDAPADDSGYRHSTASQSSPSDTTSPMYSQSGSRQSSSGALNHQHWPSASRPLSTAPHATHQRGQASLPSNPAPYAASVPHQRQPSHTQALQGPPMLRQNSALTIATMNSGSTAASFSTAPLKIKVWFEQDSCVVIRMPPQFRYADLYKKLRERRALEKGGDANGEDETVLMVDYKDETDGEYYRIENDEDLSIAAARNPKLVLTVSAA
ncbi:hypothetical protein B0A49_10351 [Cryomyces minteri]|uniref:Protein scd2/ral3 n=1 Tax=Cryomyces minteri TaxID=331657 RepID=A0A4U0W3C2_9PEZI|nr:hypothetical protein B0A49_10351 [Cryomyces minteri]